MSGGDPFAMANHLYQKNFESTYRRKVRRPLRTPAEILRMERNRMLSFVDGLPGAIDTFRHPYWTRAWMAGRYHPNPYHPPLDSVPVTDDQGLTRTRPVITEPVPGKYVHLPQYRDGIWSYIGEEEL